VITAWRLVKARLANRAFTGEGAVLEVFANISKSELLAAYMLIACEFDESLVERLSLDNLPKTWRSSPGPPELQTVGDDWLDSRRSAVLEVPSAIIERERNFLQIGRAHV